MKKTILLVEDDPADQMMIRRAFEEGPIEVRLCVTNDGEEALDYLYRRGKYAQPDAAPFPDLVLVDLNMPRLSGREVVRSVRADPRYSKLPIVVLTTSNDERDIAELYEIGANSYHVKSGELEEFRRTISSLQEYWLGGTVELPPAS